VTSSERSVLDTNVVVSAVLLPRSVPRQAFDLAFVRGVVLVSDSTLTELNIVHAVSVPGTFLYEAFV
jgi:predicted nucleic acid-binding protein